MGELMFIFNDMSKSSLESKVHSKVGQTSRNLRGITQLTKRVKQPGEKNTFGHTGFKRQKERQANRKWSYSMADVFRWEVDDLLVHGPFLIALHDGFLKAHRHFWVTTQLRSTPTLLLIQIDERNYTPWSIWVPYRPVLWEVGDTLRPCVVFCVGPCVFPWTHSRAPGTQTFAPKYAGTAEESKAAGKCTQWIVIILV